MSDSSYLIAVPESTKPSPADFVEFLPWACFQFQLEFAPIINAMSLAELDAAAAAAAVKESKKNKSCIGSAIQTTSEEDGFADSIYEEDAVFIDAVYSADNLVQLRFKDNISVPRELIKIITLIVQFHKELTAIYINRGLRQDGLYELCKLMNASNITEVILDSNGNKKLHYYLLLENSNLKYLSLARCHINDNIVKELASRLIYPVSASKTLTALSLSTNAITDEGAIHLGNMLRSNRKLAYLNLTGNMITDTGAESILDSLIEFPLTLEEKKELSIRKFNHMKEKKEFLKDLAARYAANANLVHASPKAIGTPKKGNVTEQQNKSGRSQAVTEPLPCVTFREFIDPFSFDNLVYIDDVLHSCGNNTLCYVNLSYNNIGYISVNKLLTVFTTQLRLNRKPKGLINASIEGNMIPDCSELVTINSIIQTNFEQLVQITSKDKMKKGRTSLKSH